MKSPMFLLLSVILIAPASAQQLPASSPASAAAKIGTLQYAPAAHRLPAGNYRAEVRRGDAAAGADEVAWSSAPHATLSDALREACKMIETVYAPGMRCPPAPVTSAKKTLANATVRKPMVKTAAANSAKRTDVATSPVSGYEVRGCAFYALVNNKVVQRCPAEGGPGTKPFWHNEDLFEGGYAGWGR
jgi:hypothetical protein